VEIVDERGLATPDKFYKSGSTIELKCVISKIPQPTSYVNWKHGSRLLNYDTSRGGIRYKSDSFLVLARSRMHENVSRCDVFLFSLVLPPQRARCAVFREEKKEKLFRVASLLQFI
jgi:hypothetical protein